MINRRAMNLSKERLLETLEAAIREKNSLLKCRDEQYGKGRTRMYSYGENLYMPDAFGFDMREYYDNPAFALETELRSKLFWLDNSHDDGNSNLTIGVPCGMYFDMTLFGVEIAYTSGGIPNMAPHPLSEKADLSTFGSFDFEKTGDMEKIIQCYETLVELSKEYYNNKIKIVFPTFDRGPLDILIQTRGYENFVDDIYEEPEFVREALDFIVERRAQYGKCRAQYLGLEKKEKFSRIADDWINFPFITPEMFYDFILPAYQKIEENEGKVNYFHTCGVLEPIAADIIRLFPNMKELEVSAWNDPAVVNQKLPDGIGMGIMFKNAFYLTAAKEAQEEKLKVVREIAKQREVATCAQAFVRIHPTLDESIERMNGFIDLAHDIFYQ